MNAADAIAPDTSVIAPTTPGPVILLAQRDARVVAAGAALVAAIDAFSKASTRAEQSRTYLIFIARQERLQTAINQYHEH